MENIKINFLTFLNLQNLAPQNVAFPPPLLKDFIKFFSSNIWSKYINDTNRGF